MDTYIEERPWGKFEQFCHNENVTVKIITVKANFKLSLQYHNNREEFWRIVYGSCKVVLGEEIFYAKEGDSFFIKKGVKHRVITEDNLVKFMEISYGNFDENDIVRLEDSYGRS